MIRKKISTGQMGPSYGNAAMAGDRDSPAVISDGLPWLTPECSARWIGHRLVYWPNGIPQQRRISVVSSRIRERLDLESWWFDLLRTAVLQCDPATEALCAVNDSTAFEATVRASELFGRPLLRFDVAATDSILAEADTDSWLRNVTERSQRDSTRLGVDQQLVWNAVVSPQLIAADYVQTDRRPEMVPLADRLLFAASDRLYVLSCRDGGNIATLLNSHGVDEKRRHVPVLIASDRHGKMPESVSQLSSSCVPWLVQPFLRAPTEQADASDAVGAAATAFDESTARPATCSGSNPLSHPSEWLLHWTRPACGPWPGESRTDFLDSLILGCEATDRSALATLLRIVTDGVLRASPEGIRGGHSVVAFTQVPLIDFRARRVFRKHRRRFDFEPWGLAIRRDVLESGGARQVIYGGDQDWSDLPTERRPWFQKATSGGSTDNLSEREWRTISDVDVKSLPLASVCVFADTNAAAALISRHCPWPVVVVPFQSETSRQR